MQLLASGKQLLELFKVYQFFGTFFLQTNKL